MEGTSEQDPQVFDYWAETSIDVSSNEADIWLPKPDGGYEKSNK